MSSNTWRQIISIDKIDACAVLSGINTFPFFTSFLEGYYNVFPKFPKKCPFSSGKYYVENVTIVGEHGTPFNKVLESLSPTQIPNGVYRTVVKFYTDAEFFGSVMYNMEFYDKMNEDRY